MTISKNIWKNKTWKGWPLLAFGIPFLFCTIILVIDGVYPFGDRCILHVDMYHQYCPFFTEFLNKLKNGESLMYSWNIGLGSDFFAVFVYYLSSPLNWLIILCPAAHVIEFMTLLILIKIGFSGFSFWTFCTCHFGKKKNVAVLVFSTAYAMSGFVAAYSWDIMWMDCIMLAPLIFVGLEKLMKDGQPALYYITLSLAILSNYYMSIMICLFLVFYFGLLFFEMGEDDLRRRWKGLGRFTLYSLLAGGTGVVLMLPEMIVLGYSGSSGFHFPESLEWYFDFFSEFARMCAAAEPYTGAKHWPNLYAGAFSILLLALYLLNPGISKKKKLPRLLMVAFFFVSFANNWLDFIWHGLHFPDSLPGRQSFLFAFLVLTMGYESWLKRKYLRLEQILTAGAGSLALLAGSLLWMEEGVTSKEALFLTIGLVSFYALALILEKIADQTEKAVRWMFILVALAELFFNMLDTGFVTNSREKYMAKTEPYSVLLEQAEQDARVQAGLGEDASVFFRVEDTERLCKNDDTRYGYASATQFSSLMNIHVSHFFQRMYMEGGKNFYCYNGATPFTSALLSVGYMLSDDPSQENALRTLVAKEGNICLYRNNYCLPMAYVMPEDAADIWENSNTRKIDAINELASLLGAGEDLLTFRACEQDIQPGTTTLTFPHSGYYYGAYTECKADTLTFTDESGNATRWSKATHKYLFEIGYAEGGSSVTITNKNGENLDFNVYELNLAALDRAYGTLCRSSFQLTDLSSTHLEGTLTTEEGGRLILPIADEPGWTLKLNGEETETKSFGEAFISTEVIPGTYEISLDYKTPGLKAGTIFSAGCFCIFLLLTWLRRKF